MLLNLMYQLGSSMLVKVEYIWFGYEEKTKRDRVSNLIEDEKKSNWMWFSVGIIMSQFI